MISWHVFLKHDSTSQASVGADEKTHNYQMLCYDSTNIQRLLGLPRNHLGDLRQNLKWTSNHNMLISKFGPMYITKSLCLLRVT